MLDDAQGAGGAPDAAAAAAAAAAQAAAGNTAWYAAFAGDPDTAGYITSKGLDKAPDIATAFKQVAAFHRQAEGYIGVPEAERLRAPNPADPASVQAFWAKFGTPDAADKYDFAALKNADGTDRDFVASLRQAAFENHLPVEAATKIAASVAAAQDAVAKAQTDATTAKLAEAKANLTKNWGPNYAANMQLAHLAAKRLGVDIDTTALLAEKVGADKVLEMFRRIGAASGEDTFVVSPNKEGAQAPMAITEAKQVLDARKADKAWGEKLIAGDFEVNQEYTKLMIAAYPDLYAAAAA